MIHANFAIMCKQNGPTLSFGTFQNRVDRSITGVGHYPTDVFGREAVEPILRYGPEVPPGCELLLSEPVRIVFFSVFGVHRGLRWKACPDRIWLGFLFRPVCDL